MSRVLAAVGRRWRAVTGAASAATIALGVLVLGCAAVAMAGPRAGAMLQTSAVRQLVAQTPPDAKVIVATDGYTQVAAPLAAVTGGQLAGVSAQLRSNLAALPLAAPGTDLMAFTTGLGDVADSARSLGPHTGAQLELVYQTGLAGHVRLVSGVLPSAFRQRSSVPVVPIAVTVATARRFGLRVGSELPFSTTSGSATVKVSGIIAPVQPSSPFWAVDPLQFLPAFVNTPQGAIWQGGAFIAASELTFAERLLGTTASVRWVLPLSLSHITGRQAIALSAALPAAVGQAGGNLQVSPSTTVFSATASTGLTNVLAGFAQQAGSVNTLLSLLSVSLTAVCVAVLLLAVWLVAEQRYGEFAMLRARGASRGQLAWLAVRGCLVAVLAGAVAGVVVAIVVTPGGGSALGWWLSGLSVGVVLAGLPVLTARRHRASGSASGRVDVPAGRRAAARRLVVEAVLVLASAGGLVVLRVQGLAAGGGDPYTSLAPVLVAVPLAVLVLRCYPWLARPVLVLSGRRHGVAGFVGLARAIRTAVTAGLPVFALVLALALVGFGGMVRGAVVRGEVLASWQSVGGDAVVTDPAGLSAAAQRSIAAVPGVQHTAALTVGAGTFPGGATQFGIVGVDPAQYRAFLADVPGSSSAAAALSGSGGSGDPVVPVLATPGLAGRLHGPGRTVDINDQPLRVRLASEVNPVSVLSTVSGGQYLMLPVTALGRFAGQPLVTLVIGSRLNHQALIAAVRRVARGASVSFRSAVLAGLERAPLQHGAYLAFVLASVVAGVLSVLVLLLALVIGGRSRRLTLARMSTMGLSAGQGRRVAIVEVVPQVLAAVIGGAASAALLAPLVGPSLDLSVFTGTGASVPVDIDPQFLAVAVLALVVLALLTLVIQTMVAGRTIASALRIGE